MKNLFKYKLKTHLAIVLLCITFTQSLAQLNQDSLIISSDTTKVRANYEYKAANLFEKVKIPLWKVDGEKRAWLLPAVAWNNYDKTQIGLLFRLHKDRHYSVTAIPMYGVGSKNLTGVVNATYNIYPKKVDAVQFRLNAKRFSYLLFPEDLTYNRLQPEVSLVKHFKFKGVLHFKFKHSSIWQEYILGGRKTTYFYANQFSVGHRLNLKQIKTNTSANFLQADAFGTFEIQNKLQFTYNKANKFYWRNYLGAFLYNSKSSSNIQAPLPVLQLSGSTNNGIYWLQKDFLFDDFYLDRNAQDDFFRRQVASSEGGFLSLTSIGNMNSFLFASNIKTDVMLPAKIQWWVNVQPYVNFAVGANKNASTDIFVEGGATLLFFREVLGFHIPFATSNNIKDNQLTAYGIQKGDWPKRITFSIHLQKLWLNHLDGINH